MAAKAPTAYLPGYKDVKHHELRTAETDASYLLPTLQSMVANNPNLTLLDIGAGSGTITASLAKYLPRGEVTALDLSEEILKQASAYAKEKGINNIRFQTANVNNLPFADNTFDVVHTSQMLCYQSAPADSLREMLRVLKPGGVVAVRECDMRMWSYYPELPALKKFHQIQIATHAAAGGSNVIGPQLVSLALKAGARREQCEMSMGCWCYAERRERMVWGVSWAQRIRSGEVGKKALSMGLASESELEAMAKAWEEWAATEDASFSAMHGQILIRK